MTKGERNKDKVKKWERNKDRDRKEEKNFLKLEHTNRGSKLVNHLLHLYVQ